MKRYIQSLACAVVLQSGMYAQQPAQVTPMNALPQTQSTQGQLPLNRGMNPVPVQGDVVIQPQYHFHSDVPSVANPVPPREPNIFERCYQDDLFHYTWIDFGESPGLRIHRIEMTNAWADMRAVQFFSRPISFDAQRFQAGLSFGVQWWKDQLNQEVIPVESNLPPVVYDLYADFGYRLPITPTWVIDLAISPGLATDFRITPPDGFRMKGHAIAMLDMLPGLRGVLGISYQNRENVKVLPVAGLAIDLGDRTHIEAIFPQPRLIHMLGEWRGTTWDVTVGGEFGGGSWAFKNWDNERETIDYRDLRVLVGLNWNNRKGQGTLQAGYVFQRELNYGIQTQYDFDPGNAWMVRVGWDF